MIQIQNTLVSLDLLEKRFVCDLQKCKGACCVGGDAGAPLSEEELPLVERIYDEVKPFMRIEGIRAIEKQGKYVIDEEGEPVTPLVKGAECAYVVFDNKGATKCAFELAYMAGRTNFKKPVSCHLYPVRVAKYNDFEAVNYHQWNICKPACECGKKLDVKIYQFVKEALVRRFGEKWLEELKIADELLEAENKIK
jgi:hypothetical protein